MSKEYLPHFSQKVLITTNLAVGCYCADERRCHRSILRELLAERGARIE